MPFSISTVIYFIPIIPLSVKQNIDHAWFLESHTFGKLILPIHLSVK